MPARKQKELANLLQETTLSAIITAAKTVADRLKFISALESIVFDPETKARLKERTQLHKILAENTWVFGEEYNLWVARIEVLAGGRLRSGGVSDNSFFPRKAAGRLPTPSHPFALGLRRPPIRRPATVGRWVPAKIHRAIGIPGLCPSSAERGNDHR